jgi:hypothetical protein
MASGTEERRREQWGLSKSDRGNRARGLFYCLLATGYWLLPGCESGGNFTILGYSTAPNYATNLHTVRVPIFKNTTMRRGVEFDLTRAVIREIEAKTPYKVVGDGCPADSELSGKIVALNKNVINRTQLNEIREAETGLAVEVVWRDLRTGEILSKPKPGPGAPPPAPPVPDPITGKEPPAPTVTVSSTGDFIPELGQSITTAEQQNVDRLAIQIVSMMEKPW